MPSDVRYRSKVDRWLAAVLLASVGVCLWAIGIIVAGPAVGKLWIAASLLVIGIFLPLSVLTKTEYLLNDRRLLVRSGCFWWTVPLDEIVGVEVSRSWESGPALSLDRLAIQQRNGRKLLISPVEAAQFVAELRHRIAAARTTATGDEPNSAAR